MSGAPSPTRHVPPGGPYCSPDGDEWAVAVEDCGYLEARRLVKGTADIGFWQRLEYVGKRTWYLWDGEEHSHDEDEAPGPDEPPDPDHEGRCAAEGCRYVLAWCFVVMER